MSAQQTAYWPWPGKMEASAEVIFGPKEEAFIRDLVVIWDTAEMGAAGLADAALDEIDDQDYPVCNLIKMFLTTATLPAFRGTVVNPYEPGRFEAEEVGFVLDPVPDQAVADLFRRGEDIPFEASADELTLWRAAGMRGTGIDPKRPFGTGLVSRDVRALVDPEKTIPQKKFAAYRKTLESRLMLLLQYFVQNAELPHGTYVTDASGGWMPAEALDEERGDWIDRCQWISNIAAAHFYQTHSFAETVGAAVHLLWEDRLAGDYATLVAGLKLDNHYGVSERGWSRVPTVEVLELGLKEFPEAAFDNEDKAMTLMLVRAYMAASRFQDALDLLDRSKVGITAPAVDGWGRVVSGPITQAVLLGWEATLARYGKTVIEEGVYIDHPDSSVRLGNMYDWIHDIDCMVECPPEEDHGLFWHAKAIAAQCRLMRGPYRPD